MKADVLIAGGGIMGCAVAIELARRGRSAIIFEKDVPGQHASGRNSGGVRCQGRDLREVPFAVASRELWDHHPAAVGSDCGFYSSPRLRLAESDADMAVLEARHAKLSSMGYEHEVLVDRDALRRLSPAVSDHIVGGLICHTDGLANPLLASQAYAARAVAEGQTLLSRTEIVDVDASAAGFSVRTAEGERHHGGALLNTTGAWAGRFAAMLDDVVPVVAAAPTMMVTSRVPGLMKGVSLGLTSRTLGLMAASNGTVIVGGGYRSPLDLERGEIWLDSLQMVKAARLMTEVVPALGRAQMIRCWTAFEGCSPDKVPIVGESTRVPGFFHLCGFSAHGFQLAPIMGRIMAQLLTGAEPELPIDALRPERFEAPSSGAQ